jgi:hypothetical protein
MSKANSYSVRSALFVGCSAAAFVSAMLEARAADYIKPDSLLISTTTYQNVGEVAGLVAGASLLPGSKAGKTSTAVSNGDLNTVWGNEAGDPSFGVTKEKWLESRSAVIANGRLTPTPAVR